MSVNPPVTLREIARYLDTNLSCDVLAIDNFSPDPELEVYPVRIDALIIMLCTSGNGCVHIDLNKYDLKKGSLLVVHPENYIQGVTHDDDFGSQAVICSPRVVEHILPKLTSMLPIIMQHRMAPVTDLTPEEAAAIFVILHFCKIEIRRTSNHLPEA